MDDVSRDDRVCVCDNHCVVLHGRTECGVFADAFRWNVGRQIKKQRENNKKQKMGEASKDNWESIPDSLSGECVCGSIVSTRLNLGTGGSL